MYVNLLSSIISVGYVDSSYEMKISLIKISQGA